MFIKIGFFVCKRDIFVNTFCEAQWIIPLAASIASFKSFSCVRVVVRFVCDLGSSVSSSRLFNKNFRRFPPEQYSVTRSNGSEI